MTNKTPLPAPDAAPAAPAEAVFDVTSDAIIAYASVRNSAETTLTLVSGRTGTRFTYQIRRPPPRAGSENGLGLESETPLRFVSTLTGPDNQGQGSYSYFGWVHLGRRPKWQYQYGGEKAKLAADAPSVRAFEWAWAYLACGAVPESLTVYVAASCRRCGHVLTTPESIRLGYGPICAAKRGV